MEILIMLRASENNPCTLIVACVRRCRRHHTAAGESFTDCRQENAYHDVEVAHFDSNGLCKTGIIDLKSSEFERWFCSMYLGIPRPGCFSW